MNWFQDVNGFYFALAEFVQHQAQITAGAAKVHAIPIKEKK